MPNPMPNAADKAALKAIAATVIQTCPSLQDAARQVASDLLIKYQVHGLDPDQVYFHRFDASQSSSNAFTGWEHVHATPTSSMTLTQLVIHRFLASPTRTTPTCSTSMAASTLPAPMPVPSMDTMKCACMATMCSRTSGASTSARCTTLS